MRRIFHQNSEFIFQPLIFEINSKSISDRKFIKKRKMISRVAWDFDEMVRVFAGFKKHARPSMDFNRKGSGFRVFSISIKCGYQGLF
jgi:hypothetical protein